MNILRGTLAVLVVEVGDKVRVLVLVFVIYDHVQFLVRLLVLLYRMVDNLGGGFLSGDLHDLHRFRHLGWVADKAMADSRSLSLTSVKASCLAHGLALGGVARERRMVAHPLHSLHLQFLRKLLQLVSDVVLIIGMELGVLVMDSQISLHLKRHI